LTNHRDISALAECFHESFGSWLGDGSEVGNELLLGHTDTSVSKCESVGGFIGDDLDFEVGLVVSDVWVSEWSVSDFVEGVWGIRDEFSKENFFVGVESVDDETHELLDISIEGKVFSLFSLAHFLDLII
jgi:hypothetical protein